MTKEWDRQEKKNNSTEIKRMNKRKDNKND